MTAFRGLEGLHPDVVACIISRPVEHWYAVACLMAQKYIAEVERNGPIEDPTGVRSIEIGGASFMLTGMDHRIPGAPSIFVTLDEGQAKDVMDRIGDAAESMTTFSSGS